MKDFHTSEFMQKMFRNSWTINFGNKKKKESSNERRNAFYLNLLQSYPINLFLKCLRLILYLFKDHELNLTVNPLSALAKLRTSINFVYSGLTLLPIPFILCIKKNQQNFNIHQYQKVTYRFWHTRKFYHTKNRPTEKSKTKICLGDKKLSETSESFV